MQAWFPASVAGGMPKAQGTTLAHSAGKARLDGISGYIGCGPLPVENEGL